ncbi:MAG: hypothetical protein AAGI71_17405 [Bacteroidota bacterium]
MKTAPDRPPRPDWTILLGTGAFVFVGLLITVGGVVMVFDDPEGFFLIAFGAIFVGMGLLAWKVFSSAPTGLRPRRISDTGQQQAVTLYEVSYVNEGGARRHRTQSIFVEPGASPETIQGAKERWWTELLAERPDWVRGEIVQEGADGPGVKPILIANLVLWGLGVTLSRWFVDIWFFLALPIGVALIALGVQVVRQKKRQKYGVSTLVLAQSPLRLGGRLRGTLATQIARRDAPLDGFTLHLRCEETYTTGSGDSKRHHTDVLWETTDRLHGTRAEDNPLTLAVALDLPLPADQPPTTAASGHGTRWMLEINAAVPGLDFTPRFVIPVFPGGRGGV